MKFKKGFNWREVTTEDKFYEMFPNIPRLPQHQGNDYYGLARVRGGKRVGAQYALLLSISTTGAFRSGACCIAVFN